MTAIKVGLIPAPGLPKKLLDNIIDELSELAAENISSDCQWTFEMEVSVLASSSEYINETVHNMVAIKERNDWDFVVAVSDLPSLSHRQVVISEFNSPKSVSLLSLPSLGFLFIKTKLKRMIIHHLEYLYKFDKNTSKTSDDLSTPKVGQTRLETPIKGSDSTQRYIINSYILGWLKLLLGMTYINEPWTIITNFKTLVSLAFATGTYIAIFSNPWQLSIDYQPWRLILLTFFSIIGMVIWLMYAHKLWEPSSYKTHHHYRRLYNFTTFMTLLFITFANYIILYILLTISITIFVPPALFNDWTQSDANSTVPNYMNLIWFTTSLGMMAGALGSTAESEEKIRNVTYSYRQAYRHEKLQEDNDWNEST